jgi:membrane protease YdiL (CAAX protease family)
MNYLLIFATPVFLGLIGLGIAKWRKLSWREDVGFQWPDLRVALLWLAAFVALAVAQQLISGSADSAGSWVGKYGPAALAIRIAAVALIYPLAEEFFFRGVFIGVLQKRIGKWLAVLVSAAVFAAIHVQYDWPVWVFADGLLFGLARVHSRSVYLPMLLHVIGNSYAVWERLQP